MLSVRIRWPRCPLLASLVISLLMVWPSLSLGAGGTLKIIPHADLKNIDPILDHRLYHPQSWLHDL